MLHTVGRLLTRGLFLDSTIKCDEGGVWPGCGLRESVRGDGLSARRRVLQGAWVWNGSAERALGMEHVRGVSVGGGQEDHNYIATCIVDLCVKELCAFRLMQTYPNWTNCGTRARARCALSPIS
ncbi:hypothetical protein FOMPIDRAFT_92351 [Fomitopsis schrenkii]|uniref:Uncharacterized protein n=1 Tax=Fomitopsis schrenkii TaxID=2126942 RepID=S8DJG1_FOMSC|nr:hypothetical protein FOMPIDRAFT_92351 [Fomitopsis schrenkii]